MNGNHPMRNTLVVGCGNLLRCDDGVGWHVARRLNRELSSAAPPLVQCVHQLTPELAELASSARLVIFIDAASIGHPGRIRVSSITPSLPSPSNFHHLTPEQLIALCEIFFGDTPRAYSVSITGQCFDYREQLTPQVEAALDTVVATVLRLMEAEGTHEYFHSSMGKRSSDDAIN